jgi:hypothetical protein
MIAYESTVRRAPSGTERDAVLRPLDNDDRLVIGVLIRILNE